MGEYTDFHKKNFERMCKVKNVDISIIDINSLWDSKLSDKENYDVIKEQIYFLSDLGYELNEEEQRAYEEEQNKKEQESFKKEVENSLEKIKSDDTTDIDTHFSEMTKLIKKTHTNINMNSFIIDSLSGMGKSYQTLRVLTKDLNLKINKDFKMVSGHMTPLQLYHLLYEYRDRGLVIDDISSLLNNPISNSVLLSATWSPTDTRTVAWTSTTEKLKVQDNFIFSGYLIFCVNGISHTSEAFVSRSYHYVLHFDWKEKLEIATKICKKENYPIEYVDWIRDNRIFDFDFRLLTKLHALGDDWKTLGKAIVDADELVLLLYELVNSNRPAEEQARAWTTNTGFSKRTYYRYKKKYFPKKMRREVGMIWDR